MRFRDTCDGHMGALQLIHQTDPEAEVGPRMHARLVRQPRE
jgi:hypothetical protein